jgi:hypothetical protein
MALDAIMVDRFAEVANTSELAEFNKTCFEVKFAEFIITTAFVELARLVYPSIVEVKRTDSPPTAKEDVRFEFAIASIDCALELIARFVDRVPVAVERLLEA